MRPTRGHLARGLTLLEVIIAISLVVMLMGAVMTFFWQAGEIRAQAADRIDRTQVARQVLARIGEEIRGCVGMEQIGFPLEQRLIGDRRSITFLTTTLPDPDRYLFYGEFDDLPPARHDLTLVTYRLWVEDEEVDENGEPIVGGIIRSEKQTLNQFLVEEDDPLQLRHDLWSHELGYLEFRYFDGVEWSTTWDLTEGNSLPQLIQVTVGYRNVTMEEWEDTDLQTYPIAEYPLGDDLEHPDRYSMIIRIPAADKFFGSRVQRVGKQFAEQLGVGGSGL